MYLVRYMFAGWVLNKPCERLPNSSEANPLPELLVAKQVEPAVFNLANRRTPNRRKL